MVSLEQLWIPIVLSAVLVFVASSIIHMVIKWHNSDYRQLQNEDAVRAALRASNVQQGQYVVPYCSDMKEMKKPEMMQKFVDGPNAFISVMKSGAPNMGKPLGLWFGLILVFTLVAAYLASRTVPQGASFLAVCRVVSLVTFLGYAGGSVSNAIWMGKTWPSAIKDLADGFIYALVTAATFGWLWPR